MLKQKMDEDRARKLARLIVERATRYQRATEERKYLVWDLEYIAEHGEELQQLLSVILPSEGEAAVKFGEQ